jgi:5-methylcytosine-specific restriction endonuclease McrA
MEARTMNLCKSGHDVSVVGQYANRHCKQCAKQKNKLWVKANPEAKKKIANRWSQNNKMKRQAYYMTNRERFSKQSKMRYLANRQSAITRATLWNKTEKTKRFAIYRRWYEKHAKAIIEKYRTWRRNNPVASRDRTNKYRRSHPELTRAIAKVWCHKRRAWKLDRVATLTKREWEQVLKAHNGLCMRCQTSENISMDHIVPLSRGGNHTKENVQPLCRPCNSRKKNRLESELVVAFIGTGS